MITKLKDIKGLIARGRVEQAIKTLLALLDDFPNSKLKNEIIACCSKYNQRRKDSILSGTDNTGNYLSLLLKLIDEFEDYIQQTEKNTTQKQDSLPTKVNLIRKFALFLSPLLLIPLYLSLGINPLANHSSDETQLASYFKKLQDIPITNLAEKEKLIFEILALTGTKTKVSLKGKYGGEVELLKIEYFLKQLSHGIYDDIMIEGFDNETLTIRL